MTKDEGGGTGKESAQNGAEAAPSIGKEAAAADYEAACGLFAAGKMAEAEAVLRKILTSDPDDAGALHLLGGIALGRGRTAAAEDLVRKAIRSSPRTPEYHDNMGAVLYRAAADVIPTVRELYGNWKRYTQQSRLGQEIAKQLFSPQRFIDRIRRFIDDPT